MKLCTGDHVLVISGKDKGKKGTILRVLPTAHRVVVGDVNMVTKHVRRTPQTEGRKVRYEASVHASNVMLLDPKTGKPTRVGYQIDEQGRKVRIAKVSGAVIGRSKVKVEDPKVREVRQAKEAGAAQAAWKRGTEAQTTQKKADAGPTQVTQVHTRSAGRGS